MKREKDNSRIVRKTSEKAKKYDEGDLSEFFPTVLEVSRKEKNKSANGFFSTKNSSTKNSCFNLKE